MISIEESSLAKHSPLKDLLVILIRMVGDRAKANNDGLVVKFTTVNGKMIAAMDMDIRLMEKEMMLKFMKESGKMTLDMARVNSSSKVVRLLLVHGRMDL